MLDSRVGRVSRGVRQRRRIPTTKIPRRLQSWRKLHTIESVGRARNSEQIDHDFANPHHPMTQSHTTAQSYWYPITQYKCSMLFSASRNWFVQLHSTEIADGNWVIETAAFEDSRVFRVTPTKNLCEISIPRRQKQYFRVWTTKSPRRSQYGTY